ncbi:MAG: type II secretion system GspH family protein [Acidobacteriota bacterium]|nr:type II secretion system GspH family protein [Acidobacteriota bacterium]
MNQVKKDFSDCKLPDNNRFGQKGFTLIEVTIAMVIFLIALLGVFVTFTYAVNYNAGNNSRAQALAVLQQQVELLRSAKFVPDSTKTDAILKGGKKPEQFVTSADKSRFRVQISVDNDPTTPDVESTNEDTTRLKEISVTVTLDNPTPGWQTSLPATVVLRRVRAN